MVCMGTYHGMYHEASRDLQDRFDSRRIADRIEGLLVTDTISPDDRAFFESRDMFFLATVSPDGQPTCSYKGGDPGFVKVVDEHTIAWPNYDGNGMYLSMGNISSGALVGLLFVDWGRPHRTRLEGVATLHFDDPLLSLWPEAQFIVRVAVERVYPNCGRYIHKYELVERSRFVPKAGCRTPVPDWKRSAWASGYLPSGDPAAGDPAAGDPAS